MRKCTSTVLANLRELMRNTTIVEFPIQAYIIPSSDRHQNEYLRSCDKRRDYVSGFNGSTGTALVTNNEALLWTDGRYFLQASQEMDENWTLMKEGVSNTPTLQAWLGKTLPSGSRIGADPWLLPYSLWTQMKTSLEADGHELIPIKSNLVDLIWKDRPPAVNNTIEPLPINFTGKSCADKIKEVRQRMVEEKASILVVTALDEIAWLLNLRGSDIEYNPVFFAYVIVSPAVVYLFADESQLAQDVKEHFNAEGLPVAVFSYDKIEDHLKKFIEETEQKVWISKSSSYHLHSLIPDKRRLSDVSPVCLMKAVKNSTEIEGLKLCHIRDAAALCSYFAWLEHNVSSQNITEVSGAEKLNEFRSRQLDFVGPSFPTISSAGPNGAIIHYQPEAATARRITDSELYLCDSGGQYRCGTTDVTRTLHFGQPTEFERECFTRVLKGQIALGTAVFPTLIKGNCLDTLARKSLWDVGLDYMHGTSHGIGHYLNVHEGPMGISWRVYPDDPGLQEGMFLSNEPGYYDDGNFGIRLENIVYIVKANPPHNYNNRGFLTFETITLVPIQTKMIVRSMLTDAEVAYIDEYHKLCRDKVGRLLKEMSETQGLEWLIKETQPIGK